MSTDTPRPRPAHTLRLVLGDQLNPLHSWFTQPDRPMSAIGG